MRVVRRFVAAALLAAAACSVKDGASPPPRSDQPQPQPPRPSPPSPPSSPSALVAVGAPARPYDLNADVERRIETARRELGPKIATAVVADVFVVVGDTGWRGARFDRSVALMRSAMAGFMNGRFASKPPEAITVYLFPEAGSYERFCKQKFDAPCIAHFGFYTPGERAMVMNAGLGLGTLTHELVHPLVEADFPNAPTWINEGIASLFEQPRIPKQGEIHGGKNWRHPRLERALRSRSERDRARLDGLFAMSDETFRGDDEDLHYATVRYVCQWLDERGELWPFFRRWRADAGSDPTGEKSFVAEVGMTPAEAHRAWAKWVLAL